MAVFLGGAGGGGGRRDRLPERDGGRPFEAYYPKPLECPHCPATFFNDDDFARHLATRCAYRPRGVLHSCFRCQDYRTNQYEDYLLHRDVCPPPDGKKFYHCVCTQRLYETISGYGRHQRTCPGPPPPPPAMPVICGRCGVFTTENLQIMDAHRQQCNGNYPEIRLGQPQGPQGPGNLGLQNNPAAAHRRAEIDRFLLDIWNRDGAWRPMEDDDDHEGVA